MPLKVLGLKMTNIPNFVYCSHHPLEKSSSPCASIYQLLIGPNRVKDLTDYIYVKQVVSETREKLETLKDKDITFLFNSFCSLLEKSSLEILKFALENKKPIVIYWHETAWNLRDLSKRAKFDFVELSYLLKNNNIVNWVPTTQCLHAVATLFGMPIESFKVVYEIYDSDKYKANCNHKNKKLRFIGSGLLTARKGFDYYVWLAKEISQKFDCEFVWYKTTESNPTIKFDPVKLFERTDQFNKALQDSSIFILTSRDDPSPLVALEALASGLPVFAFKSTGLGEVLPENYLAEDALELEEKIIAYLQNGDSIEYSKIANKYDVHNFVEKAFRERYSISVPLPNLKINDTILGYQKKYSIAVQCNEFSNEMKERRSVLRKELYKFNLLNYFRKPRVCVIGNSPKLIGKNLGSIIDKYDIVIRVNDFRTAEYKEDVGTKTSYAVITPAIKYEGEITKIPVKNLRIFIANRTKGYTMGVLYDKYNILLNEDNFLNNELYFDIQNAICNFPQNVWSSSGLIALQWARDKFKTIIDFAGIDLTLENGRIPHYQKGSTKYDGCHNFELEKERINTMIKTKQIRKID